MADTKIYHADPANLMDLQQMLSAHGVKINPTLPTGRVDQSGWDISWTNPASGQIAITVNKHPFAEEGFMWTKLATVLGNPV